MIISSSVMTRNEQMVLRYQANLSGLAVDADKLDVTGKD